MKDLGVRELSRPHFLPFGWSGRDGRENPKGNKEIWESREKLKIPLKKQPGGTKPKKKKEEPPVIILLRN